MKLRRELPTESDDNIVSANPLSTASRRLLKEFGLRYGVGEMFRHVTALVCMAE